MWTLYPGGKIITRINVLNPSPIVTLPFFSVALGKKITGKWMFKDFFFSWGPSAEKQKVSQKTCSSLRGTWHFYSLMSGKKLGLFQLLQILSIFLAFKDFTNLFFLAQNTYFLFRKYKTKKGVSTEMHISKK